MSEKNFFHKVADTLTALSKVALCSHRSNIPENSEPERSLIIMGNGPSLRTTISESVDCLMANHTMAVNFAANAPEFFMIKPRYYVLADPHFFQAMDDGNVERLWDNLAKADWPMTLFVPFGVKLPDRFGGTVVRFSAVGVDASPSLERILFNTRRAMPRPRNVLIPSIMLGVWMNYRRIFIVGADHSWMQTINVNSDNQVVSVQPHFYKEPEKEQSRVNSEYAGYHLHQIIQSFYVAFNAYHQIARYASKRGINIFNSTPNSFIDAFPRRPIC